MADDRELLDDALRFFLEALPDYLTSLQAAASAADVRQIEAVAHELKGSASNLSADAIQVIAHRLEDAARLHELDGVETTLQELQQEVARLSQFAQAQGQT